MYILSILSKRKSSILRETLKQIAEKISIYLKELILFQTKAEPTEDSTMKPAKERETASAVIQSTSSSSDKTTNVPVSNEMLPLETDLPIETPTSENIFVKSPTNSFIRTQLDSINEQIAELDHRMHKIHIVNKNSKLHVFSGSESDVEHIYETIQESEIEPIYSSPYEPQKSHEQNMRTTHQPR